MEEILNFKIVCYFHSLHSLNSPDAKDSPGSNHGSNYGNRRDKEGDKH